MRQIIRYPLNLKTLKLEIVTLGIQNFNALKITKLAVYIFAFKLEVMGFNKFIWNLEVKQKNKCLQRVSSKV